MAEGVTVANAFVQVMPSMEGATSNLTNALVPSLGSAGDQAGAKFGNMFTGKAGALLKAGAAALGGVFAAGALKDAYEDVEAGFNKVKLATGATGEAAKELEGVYLNVSKSVSGSFEDIGSAVGELNTRLGLTGEDLEKASEAMMKYAKVTGQDATKATQDVASMMRNAGIPSDELADTLGKLTVAGQAAGVDVSSLASNVTKYNAVMKQLGLTTDEQIALMSKFEVSGADTASILNAMKKGVATWAKEGKDARTEFENFVNGVADGSVTAGDAVEIFGTKGGLSMYEAAQKGQLAFDDMYQAISNASAENLDTIYQDTLTAQEKFEILGKNLQTGFFEIMEPIVDALMPMVDTAITALTELINGAVETIKPFIEEFSAQIKPIMEETLPKLQEMFTTVMTAISDIVQQAWPYISEIITTAMDTVSEIMNIVWPTMRDLITSVMNVVKPLLERAWPIIRDIAVNNMNAIKSVVEFVWPAIQGIIDTVSGAIKTITEDIWPKVSGAVETAADTIKSAIDGIKSIVDTVTRVFEDVRNAIEGPLQKAKDFIDGIISGIENAFSWMNIEIPTPKIPQVDYSWNTVYYGDGSWTEYPSFYVSGWYGKGGFADEPTLTGYGERGLELYWPGYAPYFDMYAKGIAEHMPTNGVDIHDNTFVVRNDSDIRRVAVELNTLINRQTAGGIA